MPWVNAKTTTKSITIEPAGPIYETNVEIKPNETTIFRYKIQS